MKKKFQKRKNEKQNKKFFDWRVKVKAFDLS